METDITVKFQFCFTLTSIQKFIQDDLQVSKKFWETHNHTQPRIYTCTWYFALCVSPHSPCVHIVIVHVYISNNVHVFILCSMRWLWDNRGKREVTVSVLAEKKAHVWDRHRLSFWAVESQRANMPEGKLSSDMLKVVWKEWRQQGDRQAMMSQKDRQKNSKTDGKWQRIMAETVGNLQI